MAASAGKVRVAGPCTKARWRLFKQMHRGSTNGQRGRCSMPACDRADLIEYALALVSIPWPRVLVRVPGRPRRPWLSCRRRCRSCAPRGPHTPHGPWSLQTLRALQAPWRWAAEGAASSSAAPCRRRRRRRPAPQCPGAAAHPPPAAPPSPQIPPQPLARGRRCRCKRTRLLYSPCEMVPSATVTTLLALFVQLRSDGAVFTAYNRMSNRLSDPVSPRQGPSNP